MKDPHINHFSFHFFRAMETGREMLKLFLPFSTSLVLNSDGHMLPIQLPLPSQLLYYKRDFPLLFKKQKTDNIKYIDFKIVTN
jgi:hypothetical protein